MAKFEAEEIIENGVRAFFVVWGVIVIAHNTSYGQWAVYAGGLLIFIGLYRHRNTKDD